MKEPRGFTVTDLLALAAGVALAAAIVRATGWVYLPAFHRAPDPLLARALNAVWEWSPAGLMALVPVVVVRRLRYGGVMRVGEFLALHGGLEAMVARFGFVLPLDSLWVRLGVVTGSLGPAAVLGPREYSKLFVALSAAGLAAAFRRRLAPWVTAGLLAVVWFAADPIELIVDRMPSVIIAAMAIPAPPLYNWKRHVLRTILLIPLGVARLIPLALTLIVVLRRRRESRTWVEWTGLLFTLLAELAADFKPYVSLAPYSNNLLRTYYYCVLLDLAAGLIEMVLAGMVVYWLAPFVGRWFGLLSPKVPTVPPDACAWPSC